MSGEKKSGDIDSQWENRVLCSDESCIGTIGPDGRCRECGLPYEGALPGATDKELPGDEDVEDADDSGEVLEVEEPADATLDDSTDTAGSVDDEWERRTLCPDESCIGVIGPDGRCKECGKSL